MFQLIVKAVKKELGKHFLINLLKTARNYNRLSPLFMVESTV